MKNQKGITLIALVVTIIVLLILAGVSITALTDDEKGVVTKAKEAAEKTETAATEEDLEMKEILNYADSEDDNTANDIETEDNTATDVTEISFTIDGVTYTAEEGMKWGDWVTKTEYNTDSIWQVCDGTTDGSGIEYEYIGSYDYELGKFGNINAIADVSADMAYIKPTHVIVANQEYYTENWASETEE